MKLPKSFGFNDMDSKRKAYDSTELEPRQSSAAAANEPLQASADASKPGSEAPHVEPLEWTGHWWDFTPELLVSCAPLGKIRRVIHHHISVRHLPGPFIVASLVMLFPTLGLLDWISKHFKPFVDSLVSGNGNTNFLFFIAVCVLVFVCMLLFKLVTMPSHFGIGKKGIRCHWRRTLHISGRWMSWKSMKRISLKRPRGSNLAEKQLLCFFDGKREIQIRLGEILDPIYLKNLWECIEFFAKSVERDFEVNQLMGQGENTSYTELWLSALAAPPDRRRMVPLLTGTMLKNGEYTIKERIGAGGQGVAYLARAGKLIRSEVVLKEYVLPIQVSRAVRTQAVERLEKEARILSRIKHPKIVRLIDFFFEDHRGYLVVEYIKGDNLQFLVRRDGPFPEQRVLELADQMAEILICLHLQDPPIIHRDFTPDNLILSSSGELKLIDFNVAEQKSTTTTATVVGKHAYIAPEQFRGRPVPQSDIYSLGAALYFLLCGKEPKPISQLHVKNANSDISEHLDQLIARCTAIKLEERIASAEEFRKQLHEKEEVIDESPEFT